MAEILDDFPHPRASQCDSDSDRAVPAIKKKSGCKKKEMELLDSCDSDQSAGNKDGGSDVGDDINNKVE